MVISALTMTCGSRWFSSPNSPDGMSIEITNFLGDLFIFSITCAASPLTGRFNPDPKIASIIIWSSVSCGKSSACVM